MKKFERILIILKKRLDQSILMFLKMMFLDAQLMHANSHESSAKVNDKSVISLEIMF